MEDAEVAQDSDARRHGVGPRRSASVHCRSSFPSHSLCSYFFQLCLGRQTICLPSGIATRVCVEIGIHHYDSLHSVSMSSAFRVVEVLSFDL